VVLGVVHTITIPLELLEIHHQHHPHKEIPVEHHLHKAVVVEEELQVPVDLVQMV
jgi:hypothetical protein